MNTFAHQCTHCGEFDKIPRAAAFFCTGCKARPGEPCVDMRTIATSRKPVGYMHAERQALLQDVDRKRPKFASGAAPMVGGQVFEMQ